MVICGDCGCKMVVTKVGLSIGETIARESPYKIWNADMLECPQCGQFVYANFGKEGLRSHEAGFAEQWDRVDDIFS